MKTPGAPDLLIEARKALLDALDALREHRQAVVLIGAQAIYLHTGRAHIALAEATKDSDLALDTRLLADDPLIEQAMRAAGFSQDLLNPQPGAWLNPSGIPVDLMVPEALAGESGRRSVTMPPHDKRAARRAVGLEAAVVDHAPMEVPALDPDDDRSYTVNVAGPAGLLVAKLHKLGERQGTNPGRLQDKDAHDAYRLFVAVPTTVLARALNHLITESFSRPVTEQAIEYLRQLFAAGPAAAGAVMAGRAEEGIGEPAAVAASVAVLADDLLLALS